MPRCWSSEPSLSLAWIWTILSVNSVEEGFNLTFQVSMSKVHDNAYGQVGFLVETSELFRFTHEKIVFCRQIFQSNVYAVFFRCLVEFLDALVVLFPVSTRVELAYACFCSRMKNPNFSI